MKNNRNLMLLVSVIFITLLFTACIPGGGSYNPVKPAGFFSGIWHGWIAPFTLIISLFNKSISIYEPFNTGWWYDFGFYISIIAGFGGIQFFRKKKS
ncbi:hypothetical protein E9993_03665 [Labilibacter sediminis]|nr:hypothetical protein E9993_03665 [Labilibacter sediminis]